jgi:hypothetical protein
MVLAQKIDEIATYQPSGRFNPISISVMVALGGALGIGAAFVVHLIWQATWFYLIFIFPAGIGIAAGIGLRIGVKVGKCRSMPIGVLAGLVIGFVSYMSMHYFDSVSLGAPDMISYLDAVAREGYTIFFIPVSGVLAWVLWIFELGVVVYFTVSIAGGSSAEPYCEECGQWCEERDLFTSSTASTQDMITAISDGKVDRLRDLRKDQKHKAKLMAELSYCDKCAQNGYLTMKTELPKGDGDDTEEETLIEYAAVGSDGLATLLSDFPVENEGRE